MEGHGAGALESAGAISGVYVLVRNPVNPDYFSYNFVYNCRTEVFFQPGGGVGGCGYRYIPESARWLVTQGRKDEARQLLQRAATVNKRSLPTDALDKVIPVGHIGRV